MKVHSRGWEAAGAVPCLPRIGQSGIPADTKGVA